jgi:hypothetical protein
MSSFQLDVENPMVNSYFQKNRFTGFGILIFSFDVSEIEMVQSVILSTKRMNCSICEK